MKYKSLKLVFGLMLLSVLFMIVGCGGGGGQGVAVQETPEAAVMRISNTWRTSNSSPAVVVDTNNNFIRQAREPDGTTTPTTIPIPTPVGTTTGTQTDFQTGTSSDLTNKTITLYDLASNTYELKVLKVEKTDTTATVECSFLYGAEGYLILLFALDFDEGKWWLTDVTITDEELKEGESIYYTYHIGLDSDNKETILNNDTIKSGKIGDEVRMTPNNYQNYEFMKEYEGNIPKGKITSADKPLTLKLYYQPIITAQYTVKHYKVDANGNETLADTEVLYAKVNSDVDYKVQTNKYTDYTYVAITDKTKTSGKVEADGSLVLSLYYQYNVKASYVVRLIDVATNKDIPDTKYSTEDVILGKKLTLIPIEIENYKFVGSDKDLEVTVTENGIVFILKYKSTLSVYTIQKVNKDTGEELENYTRSGTIGDTIVVTDEDKTYSGFKFVEGNTENQKILENGEQVIVLYFEELKENEYIISGSVTDGTNALNGATVQVYNADNPSVCVTETTTDSSGFYSVTVEAQGTYLLVISGSGYAPKTISVNVPSETENVKVNCKL